MPIYEFECNACHKSSEVIQKISDPTPDICPQCGARSTLSKKISQTSFVLKGGGWYSDAYASKKPKSEAPATPAPKKETP